MSRGRIAIGGGAAAGRPAGTAARARRAPGAEPCATTEAEKRLRTAVDLVQDGIYNDLIAEQRWPVRDQLGRGACTAFAVVAAEELVRNKSTAPELEEWYSEEHFYAAMRSVDPRTAGVDAPDELLEATEASGATYLAQARHALVNQGLCAADVMGYQSFDDPTFFYNPLPKDAVADALGRRIPEADLVHNIINSKDFPWEPGNTHWVRPVKKKVSDLFWGRLKKGVPVMASFPVVTEGDWFRGDALNFGQIRYPDEHDDTLRPIGGHTVCLTGFLPPEAGDTVSGGWFQFRNSLGPRFAYYRDEDTTNTRAIAPGYGVISARDVDDYCWEYLYRAGPS